jgi:hypothetical protein
VCEPRPILYISGLIGKLEVATYGATRDLDSAELSSLQTELPAVAENELRGATLSVFWDENIRRDYMIEEHAEGPLTKVFIGKSYTSVDWPDANFAPITELKGRHHMTISRSSDLPSKYHNLILDCALVPGVVK